ncbi:ABC transporter permease [Gloeocapsopsis crepidinum LEGE 06123]|uniref:ABC transporter permease n=1 Tax=Gloeocapsopsis crepidinum LEGE 06123 TaxID=588587 RepID=A0ABR9ULW2_9CHRO|nr:ABC transporter permease [Gloeocapsopsis crepidinum]MBE9189271.1 ABC transporter permease [Gloeocapsopsis crepidinum LEGE 06123]
MTQASQSQKRYLPPSTFWSLRQGFPQWLRLLLSAIALALPLIIWAFISYSGLTTPVFLPTPTAVLDAGIRMFAEESLHLDIIASSLRVASGFFVAALVGVPTGILMGTFHSMESLLSPIVGTVRYMPVVAFVPLIIIWVGLGESAKVLIIFLGVVLYNAMMIADAVKFIPDEMLNVAYTLGSNRREVLFRVIVPAVFPSVLDTLRVNISGAWNYLVIAELIASQNGLGYRIVQSQRFLQTDKVLFAIAIIGVIGLLIDYSLKLLSKALTPWADQTRS